MYSVSPFFPYPANLFLHARKSGYFRHVVCLPLQHIQSFQCSFYWYYRFPYRFERPSGNSDLTCIHFCKIIPRYFYIRNTSTVIYEQLPLLCSCSPVAVQKTFCRRMTTCCFITTWLKLLVPVQMFRANQRGLDPLSPSDTG